MTIVPVILQKKLSIIQVLFCSSYLLRNVAEMKIVQSLQGSLQLLELFIENIHMRPIDIQIPMLKDDFQELRMSNPHVEEFKILFAMEFP
jgi:hypothetical protein